MTIVCVRFKNEKFLNGQHHTKIFGESRVGMYDREAEKIWEAGDDRQLFKDCKGQSCPALW